MQFLLNIDIVNIKFALIVSPLVQSNNFPVLEKSWNGQEEIDLLDGISDCGFQNW